MHEGFREWLIEGGVSPRASGDYISRLRSLERYYGDIDIHYEKDGCASLLAEFEYSKDDMRSEHEAKHRIPIDQRSRKDRFRSIHEGTNTYASVIRKYIIYRESEQDEELGNAGLGRLTDLGKPSAIPEVTPQSASVGRSKRNVRYKGNPIGNAQNLVIRTILSNLGDESFSEKDWDEAKEYFNGKCAYCGVADKDTVRDHAIPISKYKLGEHKLGNLVPSCRSCNSSKGERDFIEFCEDKKFDEIVIKRIIKYMVSRNYVPITEDKEKSDNIRIRLHKAQEEIRIAAER